MCGNLYVPFVPETKGKTSVVEGTLGLEHLTIDFPETMLFYSFGPVLRDCSIVGVCCVP
jgi:hypothetical protein